MTTLPSVPAGPETVLSRVGSPALEFVEVDGEAVVYHCERRSLHVLNPIATLIWLGLDGRSTLLQLSTELADHFAQPLPEVMAQVTALAAQLAESGLVAEP